MPNGAPHPPPLSKPQLDSIRKRKPSHAQPSLKQQAVENKTTHRFYRNWGYTVPSQTISTLF